MSATTPTPPGERHRPGAHYLTCFVDDNPDTALRRVDDFLARYYDVPGPVMRKAQACFGGNAEQTADWIEGFVNAGVEHIVLRFAGDPRPPSRDLRRASCTPRLVTKERASERGTRMPTSEPLRVLEIGTGIAAAYAARLLADQGADVVKVEPPEGDPTRRLGPFADAVDEDRSGLFLAVNLNKRGICLDLGTDDDVRRLARLIGWANVVVHSLRRHEAETLGLDPASIHATRPDLIVLAMTPFGLTGPYADFAASELTLSHGGGWAGLCPMAHPEPSYHTAQDAWPTTAA